MKCLKNISLTIFAFFAFMSSAFAAVPPEVTAQFDVNKADIATVGASILVLAAVAMGYRWLKAMFF